ncbi:MAG: hypothetical protein OEV23_01250, partial [Gallionella sp.]|nr:hypothetical protein [Gallionella sp.]
VTRGPVTIAADGSFSFNVAGLTAPFILKAEGSVGGQGFKLVSAATGAGTANINPLTNIAVAAATGTTDPASVYTNPLAHPITQTNLNAAIAQVQAMLQSLNTAYSTTANPLTGSYSANHTGLDAILDVVSVNLDTATGGVSVDSKVTGTTIGSASIGASGISVTDTIAASEVPATTTITDLQAIGSMLANLGTTINSKGASLTATDLDPYYASNANFGTNDGLNRANTLIKWASNISTLASTVSGVTGLSLVSVDTAATPNVYTISGYFKFTDGTSFPMEDLASKFINENGSWKIKGNGHIASSWVYPRVVRQTGYSGANLTVTDTTGIALDTEDIGNTGINSAIMTGPGMPASGVPFVLQNGRLCYYNGMSCDVTYDAMDDATLGTIPDNAEYTVVYKDNANATLETRTFTVAKRPYKMTELASGSFLGTNVTSHSLVDAHYGGTFSFTYTLPTEYVATDISTEMAFNEIAGGSGNQLKIRKQLSMTGSSASMTSVAAAWSPVEAYFYTRAVDQYGRQFHTYWQFK